MHPACTALLLGRLWPICSLVAPCQAGASPLSVLRGVSPRAARSTLNTINPFMVRRVSFAYDSTCVALLAAFVAVCPVAGLAHAPPTPAEAQRAAGSRAESSTPQSAAESQKPASGAPAVDSGEPRTRQDILRRLRELKQTQLTPYVVSREERQVRRLETWRLPRRLFAKGFAGFRPVLGGMPPGSGLVAGAGYIAGATSDILQATGPVSAPTTPPSGHSTVDLSPHGCGCSASASVT